MIRSAGRSPPRNRFQSRPLPRPSGFAGCAQFSESRHFVIKRSCGRILAHAGQRRPQLASEVEGRPDDSGAPSSARRNRRRRTRVRRRATRGRIARPVSPTSPAHGRAAAADRRSDRQSATTNYRRHHCIWAPGAAWCAKRRSLGCPATGSQAAGRLATRKRRLSRNAQPRKCRCGKQNVAIIISTSPSPSGFNPDQALSSTRWSPDARPSPPDHGSVPPGLHFAWLLRRSVSGGQRPENHCRKCVRYRLSPAWQVGLLLSQRQRGRRCPRLV